MNFKSANPTEKKKKKKKFWDRVSYGPVWPLCVTMDDLELLTFCLLSLDCWDWRPEPFCLFLWCWGSKPGVRTCQQALYRLSYILSPGTAIFKTSILTQYHPKIYSQDTYKLSGDSGKILKVFVFHSESIMSLWAGNCMYKSLRLIAYNSLDPQRRCFRQCSLVLHSVTACTVQSAQVVCSEPRLQGSCSMQPGHRLPEPPWVRYTFDFELVFDHCMFCCCQIFHSTH